MLPSIILAAGGLGWLMLYRLGSLSGGLSGGEQHIADGIYGWHGLYRHPLYLPIDILRSIDFRLFPGHGQTLTRLPNAVFGALTISSFGVLLRAWYGGRTAVLTAILFACSAWTLHVSRLASNDVLYLWAVPTLLLVQLALQKLYDRWYVVYGALAAWLLMLYVPGVVWLVAASVLWSRNHWLQALVHLSKWWQRTLYVAVAVPFVALLAKGLTENGSFLRWLGLPQHFAPPLTLAKQFAAVPVHLFVRGPELPSIWLGKAPVLDVFTLAMVLIGAYFYAMHWRAGRSRLLFCCLVAGWILVGLGGPVGLSLLIPPLYLCAAAGIAYLLREWLKVFPRNPLARGFGITLVATAVVLSSGYNLRAYFVAWPHDPATRTTFSHHRRSDV